jgi:predicted PurR-regulated permease PerM
VLGGIFAILILYTLHIASAIALPIILAFVIYLLLQPSMRVLARLHIPKAIAALVMISVLAGGITALGSTLAGPVTTWISKAPAAIPRLEQRLSFLMKPLASVRRASEQVDKFGDTPAINARSVTVRGPDLGSFLVDGASTFLAGFVTVVVLLFFLLVSGELFLRRLVEVLPTLRDKKQAVSIFNGIELHISDYLLTITLMNAGVGVATGLTAYFCGLSDPMLWGTVAFLLNYVIILGPLTCAGVLFLAGLLTFETTWEAVMPAAIYLVIHFIEGQTITPILLARRMTLNPVLVIVSLVFWYWMWGVAGALLAVPLLGAFKIICDRVEPLMAIGHFLGTEAREMRPQL